MKRVRILLGIGVVTMLALAAPITRQHREQKNGK